MTEPGRCELCGEPMPPGEEMFKYHGASGPCPKPPLPAVVANPATMANGRPVIDVQVIPHDKQRYPTVGDWLFDEQGALNLRVSDMGNSDYEFLVAVHELVEAYVARKRGIKQEDVDAFDMEFEKNRPEGNVDEPGDDPRCPVYREHQLATEIEAMLCLELGLDWETYNAAVEAL